MTGPSRRDFFKLFAAKNAAPCKGAGRCLAGREPRIAERLGELERQVPGFARTLSTEAEKADLGALLAITPTSSRWFASLDNLTEVLPP